jgi:hypothetical protein
MRMYHHPLPPLTPLIYDECSKKPNFFPLYFGGWETFLIPLEMFVEAIKQTNDEIIELSLIGLAHFPI